MVEEHSLFLMELSMLGVGKMDFGGTEDKSPQTETSHTR